MRFATLEAICERLQCQPGDLLEYEPAKPAQAADETLTAAARSS